MKRESWKLFSWNLTLLSDEPVALPHGLIVSPASRADEPTIHALVERAFTTDAQWTGSYGPISSALQDRIHEAFRSQNYPALTIQHGSRIIAAAAFSTDADAENHLFCGPCVLPEYRSRGLGSALLLESLRILRNLELHVARALCKDGTTASKFVSPKFRSVCEMYAGDPFEVNG
jgi:predicted N-acetyltransferase YhbS